jgi:hypothetical protein
MIPIVGNLVMGWLAIALFWATVSLGRRDPAKKR